MTKDLACDIRADAASELSPARYERWGRALGRQLPGGAKFVVGGDVRESSALFQTALVEGLVQSGLDVVDLGCLPTPMVYYARRRLQAAGCAIVTASHYAAPMNGLKWMIGDRRPTPDDVAALGDSSSPDSREGAEREAGAARRLDVSFDYVASLQETFVDSLAASRRVVVDPMRGCWSGKARRYLQAIFPQSLFSAIHDDADGRFGGAAPDCSAPTALQELCEAVYRERADLGVAFDGDGDRLVLVDDEGVVLGPEETVFVALESRGDELCGRPFVHELGYSDRVVEMARRWDAEPVVAFGGASGVRETARRRNAALGVDLAGHFFFDECDGDDDALFAACRLIAHLARSDRSLADLRRACPPSFMTPELRLPVAAADQPGVLERIRAAWAEFPQRADGGLRIEVPGGWALVRGSATEPALVFRFEGLDWHALEALVRRFCDLLPERGDDLWDCYRAATGIEEL